MNIREGLKRTAIIFVFFWISVWSFVAWQSHLKSNTAYEEMRRHNDNPLMQAYWVEKSNEAGEMMDYAVIFGLFVPAGVLILFPFGWFIYRGFKPKV